VKEGSRFNGLFPALQIIACIADGRRAERPAASLRQHERLKRLDQALALVSLARSERSA
jgi:hypothetical protein